MRRAISNFSRSARLALRNVCAAIDCKMASVFLTRWLGSSISRPCSISPRAIVVAIRTAKPVRSTRTAPMTLVIADFAGGATSASATKIARGYRPAGKRRTCGAGDQQHALERHGCEGSFGLAEHFGIERRRSACRSSLADWARGRN